MSAFPVTRLRRLRRTGALRSLVRETRLDLEDFVMPLFVGPATEPNDELPAMGRWSVDEVGDEVERLGAAGVRAVILFGIPDEKDEEGEAAFQYGIRAIKDSKEWREGRPAQVSVPEANLVAAVRDVLARHKG